MYNGSMRLLALEGATPSQAVVELWRTYTSISSEGLAADHEIRLGEAAVGVAAGNVVPFAIGAADFQPVAPTDSDFIVLTVRVPDFDGFVFRSSRLPSLPNPAGASDVADTWLAGWSDLLEPDLAAALPPVPMSLDQVTTINALSLSLGPGKLTLAATGLVTAIPGTPFTGAVSNEFRYTVSIVIEPASMHQPGRALVARPLDDGRIVFSGTGFSASVTSVVLNLVSGLVAVQILPGVIDRINASLQAAIVKRAVEGLAGAGATLPPGGGLPAGVWITVPAVTIRPQAMTVWAALNAFGELRAILLPATGSPGSPGPLCVVAALATLLPAVALPILRAYRRQVLARSEGGQRLIEIYRRHGAALVTQCQRDPAFRSWARRFILRLVGSLARGHRPVDWVLREWATARDRLPPAMAAELEDWLARFDPRRVSAPV